ncbi:MAG TPA: 4Fe-4S dicluster domain-containing protein [Ilumatobacter sp.]
MVIDTRKCVGCHACTLSCVAENKLPPGVVYRPVIDQEFGTYPNVTRKFLPRPCMQCDEPPCVPVCPVGATWKRDDGITAVDYDQCIGCRYCITACPYSARTFDVGGTYTADTVAPQPYELLPTYEYNEVRVREHDGEASPVGNVRKCHFCLHRLERGELPMCVTTCIGVANYFGDLDDPSHLVSEMAALPNAVVLKEELGTKPKVTYLV